MIAVSDDLLDVLNREILKRSSLGDFSARPFVGEKKCVVSELRTTLRAALHHLDWERPWQRASCSYLLDVKKNCTRLFNGSPASTAFVR